MDLFTCPVDDRIKFEMPEHLRHYTPHCQTLKANSTCPFLAAGCVGCRFDKEDFIIKADAPAPFTIADVSKIFNVPEHLLSELKQPVMPSDLQFISGQVKTFISKLQKKNQAFLDATIALSDLGQALKKYKKRRLHRPVERLK